MSMVLIPLQGGSPIHLDKAIVLFGRGSECDVVLTNSRKVSRKHCCVSQIDRRIVVRDLGSMNGIRVNEDAIEREATLQVGQVLWIGDLGFRLEVAQPGGRKAPSSLQATPAQQQGSNLAGDRLDPSLDFPVRVQDSALELRQHANGLEQIPDEEIIERRNSEILN
ncbi:FHA domain-containing protein [Planctomicrobium sp. SH668]|uniref:FHA domain-containing protein n=1 Tax=Planctomicrobium sp. SH668 TaxID=3448126 RepID=UPI003F5B2682